MRKLKVEPVPCPKCQSNPFFIPLPDETFPTGYEMLCLCRNFSGIRYEFGYKTKSSKGFITRRISLNNAIRYWNRYIMQRELRLAKKSLNPDLITCKFCKKPGLAWGKRPYTNRWQGGSSYVLYEFERDFVSCPLTGIAKTKIIIHNCLSKDNVKNIEYVAP